MKYIDDYFKLTRKYLNSINFFAPGKLSYTDISFTSGRERYEVRIVVSMVDGNEKMILQYKYQSEKKRVEVALLKTNHKLGGISWRFQCPKTGRGYHGLHFVHGVVAGRMHFDLYYRSHLRNTAQKRITKKYRHAWAAEEARAKINSKGFQKYWKGIPTKRYAKLLKIIIEAEKHPGLDGLLK